MHADSAVNTSHGIENIRVQFSDNQLRPPVTHLGQLFAEKVAQKEFFYGLEVTAHSNNPITLNYNGFGNLLPLFTSIVWLGKDYWNMSRFEDVPAVGFAKQLKPHIPVLSHLSCYHLTSERLSEFLDLDVPNILAVRGDLVAHDQECKHAYKMVEAIRKKRGDGISIGVAGYPNGHPDSKSTEEDIQNLLEKVNAGADFIITQICFSTELIIKFIRNCRASGISVPILVGMYIPDSVGSLQRTLQIADVVISEEDLESYKSLGGKLKAFRNYAVDRSVKMITEILESGLDVYGFQFFSMNKFKNIERVLADLETNVLANKIKS